MGTEYMNHHIASLSLCRSQGDSTEVGLYKALGSIPRLQSILLDLHVAKTYSPLDNEEHENGNVLNASVADEFDRQVPLQSLNESLTELATELCASN